MDKYDAWLEQPYQEQCEAEAEFHEQMSELMAGDYSINNFDNFMEAIQDECLYRKRAEIEEALATRNMKHLGGLIYSEVLDWLEAMAERELTGSK
jgi:hypothetical protein